MRKQISRRACLQWIGATSVAGLARPPATLAVERPVKKLAAVVTVYRHNSHADVILSKILKGWEEKGGPRPSLQLASLYVDQFPEGDLSRSLSREFEFPIFKTIDQAITIGSDRVAVDGVLSIGEHGDYPWNDIGQHLYPRRRFFEEIVATFKRCDAVVPVFNDKHLGPVWQDAKWMYDQARQMQIPFMAGSSLPVAFRKPDVALPMNTDVQQALAVGYSGLDAYGFHTLEFLQCFIERRSGAEQGVRWVQCLPGSSLGELMDQGIVPRDLLNAVLKVVPNDGTSLEDADAKSFDLFVIQYRDGLTVPVLMLSGFASGIAVSLKTKDGRVLASFGEERPEPRYPHFAYLLKGIEQMILTGQPAYPVERTLLTAGILDRLLTSKASGFRRVETPELAIPYKPVDYSHAPHIDLRG